MPEHSAVELARESLLSTAAITINVASSCNWELQY